MKRLISGLDTAAMADYTAKSMFVQIKLDQEMIISDTFKAKPSLVNS